MRCAHCQQYLETGKRARTKDGKVCKCGCCMFWSRKLNYQIMTHVSRQHELSMFVVTTPTNMQIKYIREIGRRGDVYRVIIYDHLARHGVFGVSELSRDKAGALIGALLEHSDAGSGAHHDDKHSQL